MKILALNGLLGYGYSEEAFKNALKGEISVIGVDAGSTDAGPFYLGAGKSFTSRSAVKRDIEIALPVALDRKIPFIIGTAGGAGADVHVDWVKDIIEEIAREKKLHFKMAVIRTEISKDYLKTKLREGKVKSLGGPPLTEEEIDKSVRLVSQIGATPYLKALEGNPDVILAGRSCDTAIYAAVPLKMGYDPGLVWHAAKIIECGAMAAEPGTAGDCMMADIHEDYFILEPPNPIRKTNPIKVAAHSLYEQPNPYYIYEPEGMMDLTQSKYEQYTERSVKVSGSRYVKAEKPTIKIEGVKKIGYRVIAMGATRTRLMIENMDTILEQIREHIKDVLKKIKPEDYILNFRVYGKNGVLGEIEPVKDLSHELFIIIDVIGKTPDIARTVCAVSRSSLLHFDYKGRKTTAGNIAFPYSPSDIEMGEVYVFNVYHVVEVDDLAETSRIEFINVGG